MNYYGFIGTNTDGYTLTIEHGTINDTVHDYTHTVSKKTGLSREQINEIIQADTLGTIYIYRGERVNKLL